jgi:putative flippase GtrA
MDSGPNLVGFVAAGATAFSIDAAMLWVLTSLGMDPLAARIFGIGLAMVAGWLINRHWTYAEPGRPRLVEFGRYAAVGSVSVLINYAVFTLALILSPGVHPVIALVIATAVSTGVSFIGYARYVFGQAR